MVRGPAALLTRAPLVHAAALALFAVAPVLPAIGGTGDVNTALSDVPAMLVLVGCVLSLLPVRDFPAGLILLGVGGGLLAGAFTVAGVVPLANVAKALFAGAAGMLLARLMADPAVVVAVPLFVAVLDVASVAAGPSQLLARDTSRTGEFLTVYLPAWGGGRAGVLGVADLLFAAFFASSAWRFGLRRRATAAALLAALPLTLVVQLALHRNIPALPPLAAALLLPNLDLLPPLLRSRSEG